MRRFLCCLACLLLVDVALAATQVPAPPGNRAPPPAASLPLPGNAPPGATNANAAKEDNTPVAMPSAKELARAISIGTGKLKLGYDGRASSLYLAKDIVATDGAPTSAANPGNPSSKTSQANSFNPYQAPKQRALVIPPSQSNNSNPAPAQSTSLRSDNSLKDDSTSNNKSSGGSGTGSNAAPPQSSNLPLLPTVH